MTRYAERMKQIIQTAHPLLKEAGFRKRRHIFNRETEPGFVQVLGFQMGPHEPGPQFELPPIKVNLYGKFTINLGIYIEEVHTRLLGTRVASFIPEYVCEIRCRLPELMPEDEWPVTNKGAGWWSLDEPPERTAIELRDLVARYALPFFETLKDRDSVIELWHREPQNEALPGRAPLSIAVILFQRGDREGAERLMRDYVREGFSTPGHGEFVREVAESMGISLP